MLLHKQLFDEYGWKRVGAFNERTTSCHYATQLMRDIFIKKQLLLTEWTTFDRGTLTDELIRVTVANLKRRARG